MSFLAHSNCGIRTVVLGPGRSRYQARTEWARVMAEDAVKDDGSGGGASDLREP